MVNERQLLIRWLNILHGFAHFYKYTEIYAYLCVGNYVPKIMIPQNAIQALIAMKIPLKQLDLDVGVAVDEVLFSSLLWRYAKTLTKLFLYRGPPAIPMPNFPFHAPLENLRHLQITITVALSLDFLPNMPNLKTLVLCEPPDIEPQPPAHPYN